MAKSLFSAADARAMIENLSAARMERIENSIVNQIEAACAEGDSQTIWRSALPDYMRKRLDASGYKVTEVEEAFLISWG